MIQSYILITRISHVAVSAASLKLKVMELHFFWLTTLQLLNKIKFSPIQAVSPFSLQELFPRVQVFGLGLGHTSLYPTFGDSEHNQSSEGK